MLYFNLASIYEVETKVLNQAIKRNIKRFPDDFMYQLTKIEFTNLRQTIGITNNSNPNLKSQSVTSSWGGIRKLPWAFTEQGIDR